MLRSRYISDIYKIESYKYYLMLVVVDPLTVQDVILLVKHVLSN